MQCNMANWAVALISILTTTFVWMIILTIWKIFELKRKLKWYFAKRGWRWGKAILGKAKDYYDEKLEEKDAEIERLKRELDDAEEEIVALRKKANVSRGEGQKRDEQRDAVGEQAKKDVEANQNSKKKTDSQTTSVFGNFAPPPPPLDDDGDENSGVAVV